MKRSLMLYIASSVLAVVAMLWFLTTGFGIALSHGNSPSVGKEVLSIVCSVLVAIAAAQLFCRAKDAEMKGC